MHPTRPLPGTATPRDHKRKITHTPAPPFESRCESGASAAAQRKDAPTPSANLLWRPLSGTCRQITAIASERQLQSEPDYPRVTRSGHNAETRRRADGHTYSRKRRVIKRVEELRPELQRRALRHAEAVECRKRPAIDPRSAHDAVAALPKVPVAARAKAVVSNHSCTVLNSVGVPTTFGS
jgi:hypothetical protein